LVVVFLEEIQNLLVKKFKEIHRRTLLVLNQLSDDEVNWRPNESSNSISNLVVHIRGNVDERISNGILHNNKVRNRKMEFENIKKSKQELIKITNETYMEVIETIENMPEAAWHETQLVRNKERTHLDMLLQCAAHFSEHLGQIMYIGKWIKNEDYVSTSIPKKVT